MTVTGIVNKALFYLREKAISSLTEGTTRSNIVQRVVESAMDEVLMEYEWSCAYYRARLSLTGDSGVLYDNVFRLPADPYCLKIRKVESPTTGWKRRARFIETDADEVVIEYTRRIANERDLDAWLIEPMARCIAYQAAPGLTNDKQVQADLQALYQMALLNAKRNEAEQMPDEEPPDLWDERLESG